MFGISRRRSRGNSIDAGPMAFVLCKGGLPASVAQIKSVFDPLTSGAEHLSGLEIESEGPPVGTAIIGAGVPVVFQWMPGGIPTDRFGESAERHEPLIDGHDSHIAVLSPAIDAHMHNAMRMLHATAVVLAAQAIAMCARCQAVYWRNSDEFYQPDHWTRGCNNYLKRQLFPVDQIVRFMHHTEGGSSYLMTVGMSYFGLPEIELWDFRRPGEVMRSIAEDAVLDSVARGDIGRWGKTWEWGREPAVFAVSKQRSVLAHGQKVTVLKES